MVLFLRFRSVSTRVDLLIYAVYLVCILGGKYSRNLLIKSMGEAGGLEIFFPNMVRVSDELVNASLYFL